MSPRTQEANEALHGERRATILEKALIVFVEKGFGGTRIQEIAERCSMSYGLVYHYFPTRDAIFTTLVDMALGAAKTLIQSLPENTSSEALGSFVGFAVSGPSPLYFALIVEALTKQGVPPELAARTRETVMGFASALASVKRRQFPSDADGIAESLLAILLGTSIMKICGVSDGNFAADAAKKIAFPSEFST